jgi:2-amino-4-hydroxy-6-hydroxymethyldihydropteridine diphosphokinase
MAERVLIALGSNVGDRAGYLGNARTAVSALPLTRMLAASRVEETAPFGPGAQGPYLNQMLLVATQLAPVALLRALQRIEHGLGRVRSRRWGARTIDLDIVRFGERSMCTRELILPHPGLPGREFWQRELQELDAMQQLQRAA